MNARAESSKFSYFNCQFLITVQYEYALNLLIGQNDNYGKIILLQTWN